MMRQPRLLFYMCLSFALLDSMRQPPHAAMVPSMPVLLYIDP